MQSAGAEENSSSGSTRALPTKEGETAWEKAKSRKERNAYDDSGK